MISNYVSYMDLVSPSDILSEIHKNPVSEMRLYFKPYLTASISYVIVFSDVREPLGIKSKMLWIYVRSRTGTWLFRIVLTSFAKIIEKCNR